MTERRSRNGIPFTHTRVEGPFFVGAAQREPSSLGSAPAAAALSGEKRDYYYTSAQERIKGEREDGGIKTFLPRIIFSPFLFCRLRFSVVPLVQRHNLKQPPLLHMRNEPQLETEMDMEEEERSGGWSRLIFIQPFLFLFFFLLW